MQQTTNPKDHSYQVLLFLNEAMLARGPLPQHEI
jgi:hypothetical protein